MFVDDETRHKHEMYCSAVLWPNLHNVVESCDNPEFDMVTDIEGHLEAYRAVNRALAVAMKEEALLTEDDLVWLHGYEIMLLPKLMVEVYVCFLSLWAWLCVCCVCPWQRNS